MAGQVSLKSIAEACSLSVSTVSQILNDKPNNFSSEETKRRVREAARKLGYRTNFGYKLMRGQETRTFAILTSMQHMKTEEHIRELVINLMSELNQRGYASYFSPMGNNLQENLDGIRDFMVRGVEHFIILGTPVGYLEIEKLIGDSGKRLISTSPSFKRYLTVDVIDGAAQIFRFLHGKAGDGFRFLALSLNGSPQHDIRFRSLMKVFPGLSEEELVRRYCRYMTGVPYETHPDKFSDMAFRSARLEMEKLFREEPGVRAVCCQNDIFALGAAAYLVESGRIIGKDVLLGGFNNDFGVRNSPFPISSVDHGWSERSGLLIDAALAQGECHTVLKPIVYIREYQSIGKEQ